MLSQRRHGRRAHALRRHRTPCDTVRNLAAALCRARFSAGIAGDILGSITQPIADSWICTTDSLQQHCLYDTGSAAYIYGPTVTCGPYTYDSAAQTGTLSIGISKYPFAISGSILPPDGLEYPHES